MTTAQSWDGHGASTIMALKWLPQYPGGQQAATCTTSEEGEICLCPLSRWCSSAMELLVSKPALEVVHIEALDSVELNFTGAVSHLPCNLPPISRLPSPPPCCLPTHPNSLTQLYAARRCMWLPSWGVPVLPQCQLGLSMLLNQSWGLKTPLVENCLGKLKLMGKLIGFGYAPYYIQWWLLTRESKQGHVCSYDTH